MVGVIGRSALKLARLTLRDDRLLWMIAAVLAATTAMTGRENVWLFVLSGVAYGAYGVRPRSDPIGVRAGSDPNENAIAIPPLCAEVAMLAPAAAAAAGTSLLAIGWFFARAGLFVFGSGLAVVPFLYGGVVSERHWLTDQQFLDAVAVAMITPGPVVITVAFIGYLVRGTSGMIVAALGIFLPVYFIVVVAAPWFRRHHSRPAVKRFVTGVTAAATGAIAGAAVLLGRRALVDAWTIAIAASTFIVLWRWRVSELWAIAAAGGLGLCLR